MKFALYREHQSESSVKLCDRLDRAGLKRPSKMSSILDGASLAKTLCKPHPTNVAAVPTETKLQNVSPGFPFPLEPFCYKTTPSIILQVSALFNARRRNFRTSIVKLDLSRFQRTSQAYDNLLAGAPFFPFKQVFTVVMLSNL